MLRIATSFGLGLFVQGVAAFPTSAVLETQRSQAKRDDHDIEDDVEDT